MISRRQFLRGDFSSRTVGRGGRVTITNRCLAYNDVVCRSCGDACETGAIAFKPRLGGAAVPEVDSGKCTECRACAAPCPARAISFV